MDSESDTRSALYKYITSLGDDRLVLGHRLSEWCGHAPILEEDIALANIALDLVGEAKALLDLAATVQDENKDSDKLAFFREAIEYRNSQLVELPRGDFGFTIVRQFLFDSYSVLLLEALQKSKFTDLAALAAKSLKESSYHLRHSSKWIIRLGDGTVESHNRVQTSLDQLWMYTGELFTPASYEAELVAKNFVPASSSLRAAWQTNVASILTEATLKLPPSDCYMSVGGREGRHTEHLGHLLSEMQILPRSYPDAVW